jgi:transaldolase
VDAKIEVQLERMGTSDASQLKDKIAIAHARMAYQRFQAFIESEFFKRQQQRGVQVQRLLWDGIQREKPGYSNLFYVGELIG